MVTCKVQIYKLIKKNIYLILLLLVGLLLLIPIINKDFYLTHDGEAHVARFAAYYNSFSDGQIFPRWAANLNARYGSPLFIFFYPLPGYIASFLHIFGFNFEAIFKIIICGAFLLAPIYMYFWLKKHAKMEIAFFAAIVYLLIPYRFLDLYVRGDIAELISFVFIPLIFLFIDKSVKENKIKSAIIGGLFYALLILSHNGIALIFTPILLAYSMITFKKTKDCFYLILLFTTGIVLSAFFWLPSLFEGKYVMASTMLKGLYETNFISIQDLFYSKWGFGANINLSGGLSAQIGPLYAIMPFLVLPLIGKFKQSKLVIFWTLIFFFAFFMETSYSKIIWDRIPILYLLGFPWRFTALSGFASSIIIFYVLARVNLRIFSLAIFLALAILSLQYVRVGQYSPHQKDSFYFNYFGTTDYNLRSNTIWTAGEFYKIPSRKIDIIGGQGIIKDLFISSAVHNFKITAKTEVQILDNTVYFPGWQVFVDGKKVPIEFQDINHRGLITFKLNKGMHDVKVLFTETPIRLFSDTVSAFGAIFIFLFFIKNKLKIKEKALK